MTRTESAVWRQFAALHEKPDGCLAFAKSSTSGPPDRIISSNSGALRVYGILPNRSVLLREITAGSLQSSLGLKGKSTFKNAAYLDDRIVAVLNVEKVGSFLVSFGIFEERCQIFPCQQMKDASIVDIYLCGPFVILLSLTSVALYSETLSDSVSLPDGFCPCMIECSSLCNGGMVIAVAGKQGKWALYFIMESRFALIGEFGSQDGSNNPISSLTFSTDSNEFIDLFIGVGGYVYLQRLSTATFSLIESREILSSSNGECIGIGVFTLGARPKVTPMVIGLRRTSSIEFRVIVLEAKAHGLICEDLGVDEFALPVAFDVVDWAVNESSLECFVLTSAGGVNVFAGLTLRNAWIPRGFNRVATFDFSNWFNLFGEFPFQGIIAASDEFSCELPNYPPCSWGELRTLVDHILELEQSDSLSLLYYILLDYDIKTATRFAWEYGMNVEECRKVKIAKGLVHDLCHSNMPEDLPSIIGKHGLSFVLNQLNPDNETEVLEISKFVLMHSDLEKEFLDFPFDSATLEKLISTFKTYDSERAHELLMYLLLYHSRYSEILDYSGSAIVKSEKLKHLIDCVSIMLTGSSHVFKKPPRMPIRLEEDRPKRPVKSPKKTPLKARQTPRRSVARQYSSIPLVMSPVDVRIDAIPSPSSATSPTRVSGLSRQPSIVSLATPRHHPSITPSRLGNVIISEEEEEKEKEEKVQALESKGKLTETPPRARSRSLTPQKSKTPRKSASLSPARETSEHDVSPRRSPRILGKTRRHELTVEIDPSIPPHSPHHPPIISQGEPNHVTSVSSPKSRKRVKDHDSLPLTVTLRKRAKNISDGVRHSPRLTSSRKQ